SPTSFQKTASLFLTGNMSNFPKLLLSALFGIAAGQKRAPFRFILSARPGQVLHSATNWQTAKIKQTGNSQVMWRQVHLPPVFCSSNFSKMKLIKWENSTACD